MPARAIDAKYGSKVGAEGHGWLGITEKKKGAGWHISSWMAADKAANGDWSEMRKSLILKQLHFAIRLPFRLAAEGPRAYNPRPLDTGSRA
jgi:hypothetical protein